MSAAETVTENKRVGCYHSVTLGRYNIESRWTGLDYARLFLDPVAANITLLHEQTHALLAMQTDFGQATAAIFPLSKQFIHMQEADKEELLKELYGSQLFAQEGFATLLEILQLAQLKGKKFALDWAEQHLPPEYLKRFHKLDFVVEMSAKYAGFFTSKISFLAMENGFRRVCAARSLLSTPDAMKHYLYDEDEAPDVRLGKMVEQIKFKPWLVTKTYEEICNQCGIEYYPSSSKCEIASFLTYATSLTGNPRTYTESDIGESPEGVDAFIKAGESLIIGNMNQDLTKDGEVLFDIKDFRHYADTMAFAFLTPMDDDAGILGVTKTGEKFMFKTSKDIAVTLINDELKSASLGIKWGAYDFIQGDIEWLPESARAPQLVMYNTSEQLCERLTDYVQSNPSARFKHIHLSAGEGHPFRSLIVQEIGRPTLHVVNTYGSRGVANVIDILKDRSEVITHVELEAQALHINSWFSFWMGLPWDVDWIRTILSGSEVHFRK